MNNYRDVCRHCRRNHGGYSRGLCQACFKDPDVLAQYPPKVKSNPDQHWPRNYEPTWDELCELEAMMRPTMPGWCEGDE